MPVGLCFEESSFGCVEVAGRRSDALDKTELQSSRYRAVEGGARLDDATAT